MSNQKQSFTSLLPKYAEHGLLDWLNQVYELVPQSTSFLNEMLVQSTEVAHPRVVGYVFGKLLDLIARDVVDVNVVEALHVPYSVDNKPALEEFTAGLRTHINKVSSNAQFLPTCQAKHRPPPNQTKCNNMHRVWELLEHCAVTPVSTSHVCSILLTLWREPAYTPLLEHEGGLGGFYRVPLAANTLLTNYVEPVYRGILDWHRHDIGPQWIKAHPYEPYSPGEPEIARRHLFALLCPDLACAFDAWMLIAEDCSYRQLCELLRHKSYPTSSLSLPDDMLDLADSS